MPVLQVHSEIGRLRRVLMHEPGAEVDRMVPVMIEELLFDDILFGDAARDEHARLRRVLQLLGVEIVEVERLLVETLAVEPARRWLVESLHQAVSPAIERRLEEASSEELARLLVSGVRLEPAHAGIEVEELYEVSPLPNWCFQRDPQIVIGEHVAISTMATPARWREGLIASTVFRFHPELGAAPILVDPDAPESGRPIHLGPTRPRFEGGDVLVLSGDVVAVGYSERTNRAGVRRLADALAALDAGPRWLVIVKLPARRAYMHLDTVMTPVDRDACLVYPPVTESGGTDAARIFEIDLRSRDREPRATDDLLATLARHGVDLEPVPCGGDDPVQQQREQWTDGANALAVAPGIILLYDRNVATAAALDARGFDVVQADDVLLGRVEIDPDAGRRTCILLTSHELSRARGGPHCLTHPLVRDGAD
jgi:arginine deiminase